MISETNRMSRERYHRLPAALKQQYDEGLLDELESFVGASSQDPQLVVSEILSCAYAARPHFLHVVAFPRLLIRYLYLTAPHYSCFICFSRLGLCLPAEWLSWFHSLAIRKGPHLQIVSELQAGRL